VCKTSTNWGYLIKGPSSQQCVNFAWQQWVVSFTLTALSPKPTFRKQLLITFRQKSSPESPHLWRKFL